MSGKPVAEQEIGFAIAGSSSLRRNFNVKKKIFTHYFGEEFDKTGEGADMDDNVKSKNKSRRIR
jgi:hypothetical protein